MVRTIGDRPSLWESLLPPEVLRLPVGLARGRQRRRPLRRCATATGPCPGRWVQGRPQWAMDELAVTIDRTAAIVAQTRARMLGPVIWHGPLLLCRAFGETLYRYVA